ncbi:MAG: XdhC family protein [Acidobacteriota bacterium]|nr:MAG: XdhC family protein [Acidobacteriota bacterium]
MKNRPVDIFEQIVQIRASGRRAALATIVRRVGSAPRKDAARMLILDDGSSVGSVGGGCVEAQIWQEAHEVMETGQPRFVSYELNEDDAENEGLICGGRVDIFLEPIMSDPNLTILGAGHLGKATAELAVNVGFNVTVIDDRASFASAERFPDGTRVLVREFAQGLSDLELGSNSFILIVTRGHKHDLIATETAIQTPARYVGLVGSRRKIKLIVETLIEKGFTPQHFKNLFAPIGLEIGSETPEEIAVSVVAELIAIRKGRHERSSKQEFIMKVLAGLGSEQKALKS